MEIRSCSLQDGPVHLIYHSMAILPRPVSPKSAFADLKDMLRGERPHKWPILALSVTLTGIMLWGFYLDSDPGIEKGKEIIYVESWMSDRQDSDIIRQQKKDLANYETALATKQREFQSVADRFGIDWRTDEARNRERRQAIIAAINKQLDERLARAEAREKQAAQTGTR
jgi:hypothetical protein